MPGALKTLAIHERTVLAALRFHAGSSLAELAAISKVAPHRVRRALEKFEHHRLLARYTAINVHLLGLQDYGVFISTAALGRVGREAFISELLRSPLVTWIEEYAAGEYQFAFAMVVQSPGEADQFLTMLGERTGVIGIEQRIVTRVHWNIFGERMLSPQQPNLGGTEHGGESGSFKADALDWRILRALNARGLKSRTDLSKRLGIARSTVEYRLRALEEARVVLGDAYLLDMRKLGYLEYRLLVNERRRSIALRKGLLRLAQSDLNVTGITTSLGAWEHEITYATQDPADLSTFEAALAEALPSQSFSLKTLQVRAVHKLQHLPSDLAEE